MSARTAVLYRAEVVHVRAEPVRHDVRTRTHLWFVDLDDLPHVPLLAAFEARDHAGDPARTLRQNVEQFLAEHGIDLDGGRITMLTNARGLGYVFNPLSVYWCHTPSGELRCVIAEVHNTYGQRYRYLLHTDADGRADTAKRFYVSPFYPVDGHYRMSLPEPDGRLAVTITLHRPGGAPFVASVRGVGAPATTARALRAALQRPAETYRVRALITAHGIRLWLAGLPVQHRPPAPSDAAVDRPGTCPVARDRPAQTQEVPVPTTHAADRLAALVHDTLGVRLPVRIRAWDGSEAGPAGGPTVVIRNRRALRRLVWSPGELGMARSYVAGDLDVDGDLDAAFRLAWSTGERAGTGTGTGLRLRPGRLVRATLAAARLGAVGLPPRPPAVEARLHGRLHTRGRDRAAIAHHYDLSNEFYELLLDETMAYSSAVFAEPDQPLADAQRAKLELICTKLDLQPGQRLLDVGCGWGALLVHAAENYGVHVTGVTLSAQQREFVHKRIADRGLSHLAEVRLRDYRELADSDERFDAVASIEMGEHVGEGNYPQYAAVLHNALRPGGALLLQQMSRHDGTAPGGGPFIEAYIAPDMHMRPLPRTLTHLEQAGFEVRGVQALREHYVTTVHHWLDTLDRRWDEFVALQGEQVARVWRLYLVGGALSFEQGRMGVDQILAHRAPTRDASRPSGIPAQ